MTSQEALVGCGGEEWEQVARRSVERSLDVLRGPLPRWLQRAHARRRQFAWPSLAAVAIAWGLALGALAPATVTMVLLSGTAADGVTLGSQVDIGIFFVFLPMMTALVAVLLSLNHWPLRDLPAYHRELTFALLLVGVVGVVQLRVLTGEITSNDLGDAWLFVNGSTVIHILLAYWLARVAARSLAGLHAYHAHGPIRSDPEPRQLEQVSLPYDAPRYAATSALAAQGALWGLAIATASGAAAGTMQIPVLGTVVGAYFGAIYGLVPTILGALTVVTAVSWRRPTDPVTVYRTVKVALVLVGVAVLAGLWPFLQAATFRPSPWQDAHLVRTWLAVVPVVVLLLRYCAPKLARTYIRSCG